MKKGKTKSSMSLLKVLYIAEQAAKLKDFVVPQAVIELMRTASKPERMSELSGEQIWKELKFALEQKFPWRFFEVLRECGVLKVIFPEIDGLFGIPNPVEYHPQIDTGIHIMLALQVISKLTDDVMVRFAVLVHDFGKLTTPKSLWPSHYKHEERGVEIVKRFYRRLHVPFEYQDLALLVTRYHGSCNNVLKSGPKGVLRLLKSLDAYQNFERFKKILLACTADIRGRTSMENKPYPQAEFLTKVCKRCMTVRTCDLAKVTTDSERRKIEDQVHKKCLQIVRKLRDQFVLPQPV
jgi:tRNA nucleotidyltransferase (CCA-adding enzyme)